MDGLALVLAIITKTRWTERGFITPTPTLQHSMIALGSQFQKNRGP